MAYLEVEWIENDKWMNENFRKRCLYNYELPCITVQ